VPDREQLCEEALEGDIVGGSVGQMPDVLTGFVGAPAGEGEERLRVRGQGVELKSVTPAERWTAALVRRDEEKVVAVDANPGDPDVDGDRTVVAVGVEEIGLQHIPYFAVLEISAGVVLAAARIEEAIEHLGPVAILPQLELRIDNAEYAIVVSRNNLPA
jgi:hypothetical protein